MRKNGLIVVGGLVLLASAIAGCQRVREDWNAAMERLDPPPASMPAAAAPVAATTMPKPDLTRSRQAKAYPETAGNPFVSLADFEPAAGAGGNQQLSRFGLLPHGDPNSLQLAANIAGTGTASMLATLEPNVRLRMAVPDACSFQPYTLLSMAVHIDAFRDDLCVSLLTDRATWTSPRCLLKPGWNNVLVELLPAAGTLGFDLAGVRAVELSFTDSTRPVPFHLDDVMLVNNRRSVLPTPEGVNVYKNGLDYTIALPGRAKPMLLARSPDGLWRLGADQPVLQMADANASFPPQGERLGAMGQRKIGRVELLEHNAVRVRLANTWYFADRRGEWASLAVRQVRWEHCFYGDGRFVTALEINNVGGEAVGAARILTDPPAAWAGGGVDKTWVVKMLGSAVGRWSFLQPSGEAAAEAMVRSYLTPGTVQATLARAGEFADGDLDRNGFDESQGCYYLQAKAGGCRFTIQPPPGGLLSPAFRVTGRWKGPVYVNQGGMSVKNAVLLDDGSVLFVLSGKIERPAAVEVVGETRDAAAN